MLLINLMFKLISNIFFVKRLEKKKWKIKQEGQENEEEKEKEEEKREEIYG